MVIGRWLLGGGYYDEVLMEVYSLSPRQLGDQPTSPDVPLVVSSDGPGRSRDGSYADNQIFGYILFQNFQII